MSKELKKPPPYVDFIAGTVGGMAGHFVGQPLDVIKVLIQSSTTKTSAITVTKDLWKREGIPGFFRGVLPPVTMEGAINAILFTFYGLSRRLIQKDPTKPLTIPEAAFCGAAAAIPEVFVVAPMELVKIRIQLQESTLEKMGEFKRTWLVSKHIAKTEGLRGFTRGFGITYGREIPFMKSVIYFGAYEGLRQYFTVNDNISAFGQIMSGGLAGALAWAIVYPFDVVKTHAQASPTGGGVKEIFLKLTKERGYSASPRRILRD